MFFSNWNDLGRTALMGVLAYAAMVVLQLLYVWKLMPETKGQSLESLEGEMTRFH